MAEVLDESVFASVDNGEKVIVGIGVAEIGASMQKFGWPDYTVFILMLMICVVIGVYFGFVDSSETAQDYLMGGRTMKTFPIAMSLIASFISGISLLGIPTEVYVYGIQYLYILGGVVLMALVFQTVYLPIFHNLHITSTYEYLERRFDKKIRLFGSLLFSIGIMVWLPIVIYVPALAFNQVTGVNVHIITPVVCVICIFYTTIGGLKAVVWTDVIQTLIMIGAMLLIVIKGTFDIGGFHTVIERNWSSDRIEGPNFDLDPISRHTVWALVIGGSVYWLQASAVNQNMVQRYLSLPTFESSRRALWCFVFGIFILLTLCSYSGMLIYATYYKCDPLTTMLAKEKDQLLPLLVMDVLGDYPGLPGLFVAGVFSAALSDKHTYILMKTTIVILGVICVGLVFVVEKLGSVLQLSMSIGAIAAGPSLALFGMGVLLPWITSRGALVGGVSGLIFMSWLCIKAQTAIASGDLLFPEKPVDTHGCHYHFIPKESKPIPFMIDPNLNATDILHTDETFMLYRLSYLWYTIVGSVFSMVIGLLASFLTKPLDPRDVDKVLLAPFIRRLIPPRHYPNQPNCNEIIYAFEVTDKDEKKKPEFSYVSNNNNNNRNLLIVFYRFLPKVINGCVAGIIGVTAVYPLDLVKTRLQSQPVGKLLYNSALDCMVKVFSKEGFLGIYKGSTAYIMLITPEKAIKLSMNDYNRHQLQDKNTELPLYKQIYAAALAGMSAMWLTTPMDLLKIHLQNSGTEVKALHSRSTMHVVKKIFRKKGISGFYKGFVATVSRDIAFASLYFPLFAFINSAGPKNPDGTSTFWNNFFSGFSAGSITAWSITPIDVLKTRLQLISNVKNMSYNGVSDAAIKIFKSEGIRAFYKGGGCRIMVVGPLYAVAQTVYYLKVSENIFGIE
ncbi:hypothetical protein FQR65_LT03747 [Abscondita terminalis]|nr:hypothetical protein FQR65_LT03747 [Abscondita terminalis]